LPGYGNTQQAILSVLNDGKPRSLRELVNETGLTAKSISNSLYRLWKSSSILRSEKPSYEALRSFKGRAGIRKNTRGYHLYLYKPTRNSASINGTRFVKYDGKVKEKRNSKVNKSELIRNFLRKNHGKAFYSTEVAEALKDKGIQQRDVMSTVRRAEKKGLVYVRGYRTHDAQTPFREGYLITWIDSSKPREEALEEVVYRTETVLADKASISPIIQRVHRIRDMVIESTKLRDLASFELIQNKLDCTDYETEGAVSRAIQLYPDIKEVKLFNAFRYFHHASMTEEDLNAAIAMKENYVRMAKGRANRIGHNWEAVPGWFIDNLTTGAKFWSQSHRSNMDPRRITVHLMKPIGGRKHNAEVDRVWEVTPGPLLQPTIYVLECKWGLVRKKHIDDFFDVLRWSKEFGVDTPDGRQIKQGITGVFAGSSFNPKESVRLKDETVISLASYAARMNVQLLKASDFNEKLRNRGCDKRITVQKICKISKDEKEVREILEKIWKTPQKSNEFLANVADKNKDVYDFEKMLREKK
jgi:hypothetical protein